jgi:hypothetical protein
LEIDAKDKLSQLNEPRLMKISAMKAKGLICRPRLATLLLIGFAACAGSVSAPTASPTNVAPTDTLPTMVTIPQWKVGDNGVQWAEIEFDDLAPPYVSLQQCWNGMGMDDKGRIYIGFTSDRLTGGEDFAVFRYDPANGERSFLGTLVDVAQSRGNLAEGESIPKGHTRLIFAEGKVYMGSQGFHDFKGEIDDLPKYRGAHIFAFDTATNTWQDLAAGLQDGVIVKNQGILGMGILRDQHVLVGLTHPYGDIVLFDYTRNQIAKVIPGIPWKLGNPISREVIVAPSGRIYIYRGTEDPKQRDEKHAVWVYDPKKDGLTNTGFEATQGFWHGQTATRDGRKIYVSTTNGELYEFDTSSETFKDLGYLLPKTSLSAGRKIKFMYGVTLSPDEHKLYYIPLLEQPEGSGELYSYDIATGEINFVQQLMPGTYTTADLRDGKNIYMARFGTRDDVWKGSARLMIIKADSIPNNYTH